MKPEDFAELDMAIQESTKTAKKPDAKVLGRGLYMDFMGPGLKITSPQKKVASHPKVVTQVNPSPKVARSGELRPPVVTTLKRVSTVRPILNGRGVVAKDAKIEKITQEIVNTRMTPVAKVTTGSMLRSGKVVATKPKPITNEKVSTKKASEKPTNTQKTKEAPDANNYSLGGKSPFLTDAKIEKRPLGSFVAGGNAYEVKSTKNVYSQRNFTNRNSSVDIDRKPIIVSSAKKKSGWAWAITTLAVIAIGSGLGVLLYFAFAN